MAAVALPFAVLEPVKRFNALAAAEATAKTGTQILTRDNTRTSVSIHNAGGSTGYIDASQQVSTASWEIPSGAVLNFESIGIAPQNAIFALGSGADLKVLVTSIRPPSDIGVGY